MEIPACGGRGPRGQTYPKIEARAGNTSRRYAASISLGETGFFEINHGLHRGVRGHDEVRQEFGRDRNVGPIAVLQLHKSQRLLKQKGEVLIRIRDDRPNVRLYSCDRIIRQVIPDDRHTLLLWGVERSRFAAEKPQVTQA